MAKIKPPSLDERLDQLLVSWETVSKNLRTLTPDEILVAIKREKARTEGPRAQVLFRLAQRFDNLKKNHRIQELVRIPEDA
jgi:hypothetical protein